MSIVQLSSGKFLVVDTIPLDTELKGLLLGWPLIGLAEIDNLTNNGRDIEAVIATHPFHTLAFYGFYEAYPEVCMSVLVLTKGSLLWNTQTRQKLEEHPLVWNDWRPTGKLLPQISLIPRWWVSGLPMLS